MSNSNTNTPRFNDWGDALKVAAILTIPILVIGVIGGSVAWLGGQGFATGALTAVASVLMFIIPVAVFIGLFSVPLYKSLHGTPKYAMVEDERGKVRRTLVDFVEKRPQEEALKISAFTSAVILACLCLGVVAYFQYVG